MPIPFDSREYWQKRFEHEDTFEWLMPWEVLESHLERLGILASEDDGRSSQKVLNLGCGNSTLPLDLYRVGYRYILSVDFVKEVVDRMRIRCQNAIGWKEEEDEQGAKVAFAAAEGGRETGIDADQDAPQSSCKKENTPIRAGSTNPAVAAIPSKEQAVTSIDQLSISNETLYCSPHKATLSSVCPSMAPSQDGVVHVDGTLKNVPLRERTTTSTSTSTPAEATMPIAAMTQPQQQTQKGLRKQCPLEFREMDCLDLSSLAPNTFDLVFDKSTSDAIACGDDDEGTKVKTLCEQVARVTKPGGVWCVVSYSQYRQYEYPSKEGQGLWTTELIEPIKVDQQSHVGEEKSKDTAARPVVHQPEVFQYLYVNRRTNIAIACQP
ncbi:Endothelin-converting enzyme 2 [Actinomortierella wolfii]|nr:Endothelin-converting enzyme 2 [Actinomortierella wolfii]